MAVATNGGILEQREQSDKISPDLAPAMTSPKSAVPGCQSTEWHLTDLGRGCISK